MFLVEMTGVEHCLLYLLYRGVVVVKDVVLYWNILKFSGYQPYDFLSSKLNGYQHLWPNYRIFLITYIYKYVVAYLEKP